MKLIGKYTLGTNVTFTWTVLTNGEAVSLEGRDLSVICTDVFHRTIPISYVVVGNDVTVSVLGEDQISYGLLVFQLLETVDEVQRIVDVRGIELVPVAHVGEDGQVVDTEINEGITAAEISFLREIETNEALRIQAEADRVTAEISRVQAEQARVAADEERASRQVMYDDAEHVRVQNENLRIAAERGRQDAEEQRETFELIRQQSEDDRDAAEQARVAAESARQSAEGLRTSAEGLRTTAENLRASAESSRVSAESSRVTAEQARQSAEANRVSAESSRVSAETNRASAESSRASAESARVAAESARVLAEQQREVVKAEMEQMMEDATMGEPNVQADWNETDTTSDAYILNKPNVYTKAEVDTLLQNVDIDVDSALSTTSENPVQNKVVTAALATKQESSQIATINGSDITHGGNVTIVAAEGQTITIDATPTAGSVKPVSSGGVFNSVISSGVFDLSAYNSGTTYANLTAALTAMNSLSSAYKIGGMTIRFIQSSDNNYVQYMYCGTSTDVVDFINTANWEKANLAEDVNRIDLDVYGSNYFIDSVINKAYNGNELYIGSVETVAGVISQVDLDAKEGDIFKIKGYGTTNYRLYAFTDDNGLILKVANPGLDWSSALHTLVAPKCTARAYFCYYNNQPHELVVKIRDGIKQETDVLSSQTDLLEKKISKIEIPLCGEGQYITLNNPVGSFISAPINLPQYVYSRYPVVPGDKIIVNGAGGDAPRLWGFIDSNQKIISVAASGASGNDLEIVAPENSAWVIINSKVVNYKTSFYLSKDNIVQNLLTDELSAQSEFVFHDKFWKNSDFVASVYNTNGEILSPATAILRQLIDESARPGDIYTIYGYGGASQRLWAFADSNDNILLKSNENLNASVNACTVIASTGTTKAIISSYNDYPPKVSKNGLYDKKINEISSRVLTNLLLGKKITWCGDSIMAGTLLTEDKRLPNLVDSNFGTISTNLSKDGSLFYGPNWYVGQTRSILWQVQQTANDADYIIVQGGVNGVNMTDPTQQNYAPMGEMTGSYDSEFNLTTQIGTLEAICKYLTRNLSGKKIGFIITYQISSGYAEYLNYWKLKIDAFLPVLKKWGIPTLDWRDSGVNLSANAQYYGFDSYGSYNEFDPTASYDVDDRVIHNNKLYKANEAVSPGAWDSNQWTLISSNRYDTWHCNELAYQLLAYKTAKWIESL